MKTAHYRHVSEAILTRVSNTADKLILIEHLLLVEP